MKSDSYFIVVSVFQGKSLGEDHTFNGKDDGGKISVTISLIIYTIAGCYDLLIGAWILLYAL